MILQIRLYTSVSAIILLIAGTAWSQATAPSRQTQTDDSIVAVIHGREIRAAEVDSYISPQLHALRLNMYDLQRNMLETLLTKIVIEEEAQRRGVSVEQLRQALTADVTVSPDEVADAYANAASRTPVGIPDGSDVREQIKTSLLAQKRANAFRSAVTELRAALSVDILLQPPPPLRLGVTGSGPAWGKSDAPLTIVEFADFECPYCRQLTATLDKVFAEYGDKVQFSYRHLPLPNHRFAFKAAQASVCADQQGKFWDYHSKLFKATRELSTETLAEIARELKLDPAQYAGCMSGEASRKIVSADVQEAMRLGITSTPTLFVNGRLVRGAAPPEELKKILAEELALAHASAGN
jgi:protein-disulfide isomerase